MSIKIILKMALIALLIIPFTVSPKGIRKVGTTAATFLRIPIGARASGMGSSFVSMTGDPTALYWNPSVITSIEKNSLVVDHSNWLPGVNFEFVGVVVPMGEMGTFGVSTTILRTDEMEVTTPMEPMGTGEKFTASSFAVNFTYSRSLMDRFSIGGSFKYIRETIFNSYASGIAFDVGTIYETPFAGIRLGASISNFGTKMQMTGEDLNVRVDIAPGQEGNNQSIVGKLNTDEFDLPLIMRIGLSGELIDNEDMRISLSVDGVNPNDNSQSMDLGAEIGLLNDNVRLRAGYKDLFLEDNEFGLTYGLSINEIELLNSFSITFDYAFQNFVHLANSNRFTLGIKF